MKILSLDLELNQASSGAKIIEVGACVGDLKTASIVERYSAFVNPNEPLLESIRELTTITQEQVDNAGTLEEAYLGMVAMGKRHGCLRMPIVWGMGDGAALRRELPGDCKWKFGRRELDVKALFQSYQIARNCAVQAGLTKAMAEIGLTFIGTKHRADDDAINTFFIFCALIQKFQHEKNSTILPE